MGKLKTYSPHIVYWITQRICLMLHTRQNISDRHFITSMPSDKFAQGWWWDGVLHKKTSTICKPKRIRMFAVIINCTIIMKTKNGKIWQQWEWWILHELSRRQTWWWTDRQKDWRMDRRTITQTDAGNDITWSLKLTSGINEISCSPLNFSLFDYVFASTEVVDARCCQGISHFRAD